MNALLARDEKNRYTMLDVVVTTAGVKLPVAPDK
jgi:hypothetical protein